MLSRVRFVIPHSLLVVSCLTTLAVGPSSSWAAGEGKSFPETPPKELTVVELFTSQGCSACPAADKVMSEVAGLPGVLALSWSIDYWDYLGWHDTFGKPEHTERQRRYNRILGLSGVYTPQIIVQGAAEVIGSRRDDVVSLITSQQDVPNTPTLPIKITLKGDRLKVSLGKTKLVQPASVWLVAYANQRTVLVEQGENSGQMLSYRNLVLASGKLGEWTGKKENFEVDIVTIRAADADGIAILVQNDENGHILAARQTDLRSQAFDSHVDAPLHVTRPQIAIP